MKTLHGCLAWEAHKCSPNRNPRWKNEYAMRSLVLKHDVITMFRVYSDKYKNALPGKPPLGITLFYFITNNITGSGKQQEARAGVDYIKVNFHIDNFVIVDKIIDVIACWASCSWGRWLCSSLSSATLTPSLAVQHSCS